MSGTGPYHGELASQIEALFEGTLDEEQAARVTRAVAEDPEAAELYWDYVELHTELRRIHRGARAAAPRVPVVPEAAETESPNGTVSNACSAPSPPLTGGGLGSVLGVVAAVVVGTFCLAGVAVVGWFGLRGDSAGELRPPVIATVASMAAGTSVEVGDGEQVGPGSPLSAGDCLRVEEGAIRLSYVNGVQVTLDGPASYRVIDEKYGFLQDGFAMARVPEGAVGFTINTPAGKIIDCGTEFGVSVGRDKNTGVVTADMRVIDGAVDINVASPSGGGTQRKRFTKGQAMWMSSLQNGSGGGADGDVFDPRTVPGLRLWLNADAGVLRGPDDRVTEMIDLIGNSNTSAENARQRAADHRPRWHSGTINNRPTLVFEGRQYIQLPSQSDLDFRDESLSIFVVGNASGGTQYFLSSREDGEHNRPRGFRFTSSRDGGLRYQAAGVTVSQPCDMTRHAVFSVVHDRRTPGANTVTLYRNGRQLGPVVKVDNSDISNAFPLTIGANLEAIQKYPHSSTNYLRGDLGEVLIYDCVLNTEQRGKIESYLVRKYGLGSETSETGSGKGDSGDRQAAAERDP